MKPRMEAVASLVLTPVTQSARSWFLARWSSLGVTGSRVRRRQLIPDGFVDLFQVDARQGVGIHADEAGVAVLVDGKRGRT